MNRAKRVIKAFINCVKTGQYTLDYATVLIEDNEKYGFLTEEDKNEFYNEFGMVEETEQEHETE